MSFLNLRDWATKQQILATDLQGHTDRHNAVYPLTFTGNVQVQGGLKNGMAVHVPFPPPQMGEMPALHVTGEADGSGQYIARTLDVASEWDSTGDTTDGLFNEGDTDVLLVNLLEYYNDPPTHWLTHTDNTLQRWFVPARRGGVDEEGRQVYLGQFVWVQTCTTPG